MFKKHFLRLAVMGGILLAQTAVATDEFPVAVGRDSTVSGGAAYGGYNGIVAVMGDTLSQFNITAQLISYPNGLLGPRISLGRTGVFPGATPIFDDTNYLLVWKEFSGAVNGQFIDTSGGMVGPYFTIATGASTEERPGSSVIAMSDTAFLVAFVKTDGYLYGQRINRSGALLGGQIQISGNHARENSLAYDGANYLVTWVEDIPNNSKNIYGQFVSAAGSLVGGNFLIDGGPNLSDNPTSLAFDGTRYLLAYHEAPDTSPHSWTLVGRFITTAGTIEDLIVICDSTKAPFFPSVAFDGNDYLIMWTQFSTMTAMGRFWTTAGVPVDTPFVVFDHAAGRIPIGGVGFGGGRYLAVAARLDTSFTDGDVYARFIDPLTGVEGAGNSATAKVGLSRNRPNPFNQSTVISYQLPANIYVKLKVYDVLGRETATLMDGPQAAGSHSVKFNAGSLAGGVYFYRLQCGNNVETGKLVLLR